MIRDNSNMLARSRTIASASAGRPVLAFGTTDESLLQAENVTAALSKEAYKVFSCAGCQTTISASVGNPNPFCVCCGSEAMKEQAGVTPVLAATSDKELAGLECSHCHAVTVLDNRVVASAGYVHCVSCGQQMQPKVNAAMDEEPAVLKNAEASQPELTLKTGDADVPSVKNDRNVGIENMGDVQMADAMEDDAEEGDQEEVDEMVSSATKQTASWPFDVAASTETADADDQSFEELDPSMTDDDMVDIEELSSTEFADAAVWTGDGSSEHVDTLSDHMVAPMGTGADPLTDAVIADDGTVGQEMRVEVPGAEAEVADGTMEDDLMFDEGSDDLDASLDLPEATEGDPLMDSVGLDDTVNACYFISAGTKVLAMKGHFAIASLTEKAAGKNADIMREEAFATAVTVRAGEIGLRKALAAFKFTPIRVPVMTKASVQRQVAAVTSQAESKLESYKRVQAECMAIAAAGMARGFWKGAANPLKASIETELTRLGVRHPGRVSASLMGEHGVQYSQTLCEIAAKLGKMSETARKEYADMLDMVSEEPMDSDTWGAPAVDNELADADEMPMNDFSADEALDDGFSDGADDLDTMGVQARFTNPASRTTQGGRQLAALLQPSSRVKASASALADANAVLSGKQGLDFNV